MGCVPHTLNLKRTTQCLVLSYRQTTFTVHDNHDWRILNSRLVQAGNTGPLLHSTRLQHGRVGFWAASISIFGIRLVGDFRHIFADFGGATVIRPCLAPCKWFLLGCDSSGSSKMGNGF
jgi:hypothetical protein